MSDIRWVDVEVSVASTLTHFSGAIEIECDVRPSLQAKEFYVLSMAFMHAMQSAHTSVERAMTRILDILGEDRPTGSDWHETLIRRLSIEIAGAGARPALLSAELADALDETRSFRHRAMHTYDNFNFGRATPSLEAAAVVIARLPEAVRSFREKVDPGE